VKYQAVIFDLYGTLVDKYPLKAYKNVLREMASLISAPPDEFIKLWFDTYDERGLGIFQSYEANIEYICKKLGVTVDNSCITLAMKTEYDYRVRFMKLRPHATETLTRLKSRSFKTGLISDCGVEVPKLFNDMPLSRFIDVATFSCLVGVQKPDPRIYQLTAARLAVKPEACLYVGDGDSNELTGALQAGMYPVLIRNPEEDRSDVYRTDFEGDKWPGPIISSLKEVLSLL
jgi:putative hydrolase of the HAD superfamily